MAAHSTERSLRARRAATGAAIGALALLSCARTTAARPAVPSAPPPVSDDCLEARRDWSDAAVAARAPLDGLAECLASGVPPCATDMAAVRSTLAELAAHEQRIQALCREPR